MAFGTLGSTLNDELNRLANGGTYRDMDDMVDEALAAKQWANRENIIPYSTDTVGILNEIAALGPNRQNWYDFNGVCNYLAGTSGLPAAAALRQITTTGDILTSLAAYYIDAADTSASGQTVTNLGKAGSLLPTTVGSSTSADSNDPQYLAWDGINYVYLPGVNSNTLSVPDANNLDITGDIDLRAYIAVDNWATGSQRIIAKYDTSSNRSYSFMINQTGFSGTLGVQTSADGINPIQSVSTAAVTASNGQPIWVRATVDVDNGASGNDVRFFTSPDGTTWTQLGTTVTNAGTTSIYSGTASVILGNFTQNNQPLAGKIYRAQILNGIDGVPVLDVDTSVISSGAATSFSALTGQTVTVNRSTSGRKSVAVTQPTWLFGTDDIMAVDNRYMASGTYLYLPGISLNAATTPDSAVLDITGDIDLRCKVALDDWTPGTLGLLISKYGAAGNRSYQFYVNTTGTLEIAWTADGTTALTSTSTVAPTVTDGSTLWVRATLDVDNGASGNDTIFYTSTDGTNWTQLGTTITKAGTTSIYSGTAQLAVGANSQSTLTQTSRGKFFRAQVLNGIGGTVAFDANFESSITSLLQTTFTESSTNAATVTINRSGTSYQSVGITGTAGYLYPGATNTFTASATDFLNHGLNSFSYGLVYRQWASPASNARIFYKGGVLGSRYLVTNAGTTLATTVGINDGVTQNVRTSSTPASGTLNELVVVVDRGNSTLTNYFNNEIGSPLTLTVGSVDNPLTLSIGTSSGAAAAFADMELVAAYVFRQALTAAQIRQITNYFANREVYL